MSLSAKEKLLKITRALLTEHSSTFYFVGIGGVSTSSLALLLSHLGHTVRGSDREPSRYTEALTKAGIPVTIGHSAEGVYGADAVVYSHAVSDKNPEIRAAVASAIPVIARSVLLGAIMLDYTDRVGVCGTHGKSTVTAMLDTVMVAAGIRPTTLSGAALSTGSPLRIGDDRILLYEACEYKDSFLDFFPTVSVALNLEYDHADYFSSIDSLKQSFSSALSRASRTAIVNIDDGNLEDIIPTVKSKCITFGRGERADYVYRIQSFCERGYVFSIFKAEREICTVSLTVPGAHNVVNATAAIVSAIELGIDPNIAARALTTFSGIERRLEYVGTRSSRPVYYDYAHHPTEIAASVNALRMMTHGKITVVFKPHTFSRTAALWEDFIRSLSLADHVILTDVYPAREEPIKGVSSRNLAEQIPCAIFSPDGEVASVLDSSTEGAIVIMGAGNMDEIKNVILNRM